jgi:hypothetical protein
MTLNPSLRQDALLYSACAFRFVVLQELEPTAPLATFEQFWIDYLSSLGVECYNIMPAFRLPPSDSFPVSAPQGYVYDTAAVTRYAHISDGSLSRCLNDGIFLGFRTRAGWRFTGEQMETIRQVWRERLAWNKHRRHTRRLDASEY